MLYVYVPTEEERIPLAKMLHRGLKDIRRVARSGDAALAAKLADVFHNLPDYIQGSEHWGLEHFRLCLEHYIMKRGSSEIFANYLVQLDLICPDISKLDRS